MAQRSSGPGYREVAEDLRTKIRKKKIKPGTKLPPLPDLQAEYGASAGVIRDALKQLVVERLIETKHGVGSTVLAEDQWTTTEAAELMQLVTALRDEVRELKESSERRFETIEARLP